MADTPPRMVSLERAKRCVRCYALTYGTYLGEVAHRCCVLLNINNGYPCPACNLSQAAVRRAEREDTQRRQRARWNKKK